ncbi:NAD(P)-binding Rossmann-fold containing protein [Venustampulla echinocandica]|uniref:NAD(P)-binding Rossmann-fold containing protein n=1 Tax=Venustampulla echinocandica TaxID=2656787 RepID=A0A370TYG8_9HELO|nr:NAD(P)-binding Rossmann-fold containing protein [Venustampulla echinocandica]RDL40563.1 NAD(P)-binding Rossmann-fold containing protein [Venustampulla echinocandica]
MSSASSQETILLLGGTGKISSRIARLLSSANYSVLQASRSGVAEPLPHCQGVKFDWFDPTTYENPFASSPISAVFLVSPMILDPFGPMKTFVDLAREKGVNRFVLLSASVIEVGDGPAQSTISKYISEIGVEYAILRPTWFMENFSEQQHLPTIRDASQIITATGEGKVPFISADDIAAIAVHSLTDKTPHNTDHLIFGPELFTFDEVTALLTKKLKRQITHVKISQEQFEGMISQFGIPDDYAKMLAGLDTFIKEGREERSSDAVKKVTGREPKTLETYLDECVARGVWDGK